MNEQQKKLYDSIVHGLRSGGWSKIDAETEAFDRVMRVNPIPSQITEETKNGPD